MPKPAIEKVIKTENKWRALFTPIGSIIQGVKFKLACKWATQAGYFTVRIKTIAGTDYLELRDGSLRKLVSAKQPKENSNEDNSDIGRRVKAARHQR